MDLGCGDGTLTEEIARRGATVLGMDLSPEMVAAAKERGLSAVVGSGQNLTFEDEFDAVFSNAALHWMTEPARVASGVHRALKKGGRFIGEFGGQGNIQAIVGALEQVFADHPEYGALELPWYFPSADEYGQLLESAGFSVEFIELFPRPTVLDAGIGEWLRIFADGITKGIPRADFPVFLQQMEKILEPNLYVGNNWTADYVRLRFAARKN